VVVPPRPMAARVRPAQAGAEAVASSGETRKIRPDTPPVLPVKKGRGLFSILSLSPCCDKPKEEEAAERGTEEEVNQATGELPGDTGS